MIWFLQKVSLSDMGRCLTHIQSMTAQYANEYGSFNGFEKTIHVFQI